MGELGGSGGWENEEGVEDGRMGREWRMRREWRMGEWGGSEGCEVEEVVKEF